MPRHGGSAARRWAAVPAVALSAGAALAVALPTATHAADGPTGIGAKGAFLLDSGAGKALWSKAADARRPIASTTKIMTAVVALDGHPADLDKQVTVKQSYRDYVTRHGASTADLRTGDRLTVRQLLYALMLPSGCDAAYALADSLGSGPDEAARTKSFVARMNAKAAALGLRNTKFDSFDGITAGGGYSTPRDLAALARHALRNSTFTTVTKALSTQQKALNVNRRYTWYNTNKLLGSYEGVFGVKTGSTRASGPCLVFSARRDGRTVVGVVLDDAASRYPDAAKMLDYAYHTRTPLTLRRLPPAAHED
ncbi:MULTISPECIES: D-alanyl-D-alanine carboxypeptidase family protein [Streptomyces]|uniref:D-alanyl-D-alanine carboxypeptidase family protein n=1 Tax=Streptomyces TaxID=1883 RepID=UPI00163CCA1E|nr:MULTISPECIES: serine hydrolase [Streptomyces]MBC2879130.1 D-alanyl-D-alanine carboxypeptidase [Streptomyces sp. TYQ1024]UBI35331.1 serine hydrolase [Streptomyces mobaraensis]UKW27922.1 serine hydrolase [Streptomyces sp. TYQ1024]